MSKHNIAKLAVSAAALIATVAMAMPASAATYGYTCPNTGYTTTYNTGYHTWFVYRWFTGMTTPTTVKLQPVTQQTVAQPTVAKAPVVQQPVAQQPVAQKPAAPTTSAPTTTATASSAGMTADEQQMFTLVNGERTKLGILPLKADTVLTQVARTKSQDMIAHNYFDHQSPTYGSPFQMMAKFGVTYQTAGENIAGNSSVAGAHTALMNSTGHRANILNKAYTHVGIGIVKGGQYGMMFTQEFVGR